MGNTHSNHSLPPTIVLSGWRFWQRRLLLLLPRAIKIALRSYPDWHEARTALRGLRAVIQENDRIRHITKGAVVGGRFFTIMSYPGGPSAAQDVFIKNELHRVRPIPGHTPGLLLLIVAMTKKCPLRCEHCFEWDALNGRDTLSADDVRSIIQKFQTRGVAQVELSGGEPLNRFDDLLRIVGESDTTASDFWVLTSGYRLTADRAGALKAAGLTGVSVSLDHWDAAEHDQFRGMKGSFDWAEQAVRNARAVGLAVGLSLTPVKRFCTTENLFRYGELAKRWGVHFIRIVEPRAVGHYAGQPVELSPSELAVVEGFARTMQREPHYRDYPIIDYYGTYQRAVGCSGAGERFLYVDTDGDMHVCPFCQHKCGSAVYGTVEEGLDKMRQASRCHAFQTV